MSEKTEYPTAKKLRKAREDGQVGKSKDFTQTVLVIALFSYMLARGEYLFDSLGAMLLMPSEMLDVGFENAVDAVVVKLLTMAAGILAPFLLIVIGMGLFIEMLQTGMLISFKALMPSGKKLNIITNIKNIFAIKNLVEFLKSTLKIVLLACIVYVLLKDTIPTLLTLPAAGVLGVRVVAGQLVKELIIHVGIAYTVISLADFAWQRHQHIKGLMMSKEEIKQEYKESEGDPHIKQKRKHLHQEMLQEGAVQSSRKATVLVTNPTHLAIALLYESEKTPLPVVLAKGEGELAERMIKAAREEGIPVLQNIPLAHALMDNAALDQYIPSDLIEAVAQVLKLVQGMKKE